MQKKRERERGTAGLSAKFVAEAVSTTNLQRLQPLQRICRGASANSLLRTPINREEQRDWRGGQTGKRETEKEKKKGRELRKQD